MAPDHYRCRPAGEHDPARQGALINSVTAPHRRDLDSRGRRSPISGAREGHSSIFSPALSPPLDRNDSPSPRSTSATSNPPFKVEHLGLRAEPEPQQKVRPQQSDVMAGGTIDLDEIASPEILDPRQVEGLHIRGSVPAMFYAGSRVSSNADRGAPILSLNTFSF